jgi:transcriptional regulator GlxA family with amidase domain
MDLLVIYALRLWRDSDARSGLGWFSAIRDPALARCVRTLHATPDRRWTVEELAAEAGMSRSVFARRFSEALGESPLAYLTRLRMTVAAQLLSESTLPTAAIAARVGYASEFTFTRAFSRSRGVAPVNWRNEQRSSRPYLPV